MTNEQMSMLRELVNAGGWNAVRRHPELWAAWQKHREADRRYVDRVVDR